MSDAHAHGRDAMNSTGVYDVVRASDGRIATRRRIEGFPVKAGRTLVLAVHRIGGSCGTSSAKRVVRSAQTGRKKPVPQAICFQLALRVGKLDILLEKPGIPTHPSGYLILAVLPKTDLLSSSSVFKRECSVRLLRSHHRWEHGDCLLRWSHLAPHLEAALPSPYVAVTGNGQPVLSMTVGEMHGVL